jgi:hypothetical protein
MPLETASYISQLVPSNPATTDAVAQGDDHIRLIKAVLQAQFPSFTAVALNSTEAELDAAGAGPFINVTNHIYGLKGDGTTDNATAFTTAVAALGTNGGALYFPKGKYKFGSAIAISFPTGIPYNVTILGDGADASILYFPSGAGLTITKHNSSTGYNNQSINSRDIAFTTGAINTGNALTLTEGGSNSGSYSAMSNIVRCAFRGDDQYAGTDGWAKCLNVTNVSNLQVTSTIMQGPSTPSGLGMFVQGTSASQIATVINLTDCTINNYSIGFEYGTYVQGVTLKGTNISGCATGLYTPSGAAALAQLSIDDCQFGQFAASSNAIVTQAALNSLQISNSLFLLEAANCSAVDLVVGSNFTMTGNEIQSTTTSGTIGLNVTANPSNTGGAVTGNIFVGLGTGVALQAGSNNVNAGYGNTFIACSTPTANAGTNNIVSGGNLIH